jgi:hypothetical protein
MSGTKTEVNAQATHKCSFAGRAILRLGVLIAGPGVSICQNVSFSVLILSFNTQKRPINQLHKFRGIYA